MSENDPIARIENRIDRLTDAITELVRVEERQLAANVRISDLEVHTAKIEAATQKNEREIDKWVNRGIGVWGLVAIIWTGYLGVVK